MARKYKRRHRQHGLAPVPAIAVRWLGAYGRADSAAEAARFELDPGRDVACEIMPLGARSGLVHAAVGLLVDQARTELVRAYAGDSWTRPSGADLQAHKPARFTEDWASAAALYKAARRQRECGRYVEGTIRSPRYSAVVVRGDNPRATQFAHEVAERMRLPVITMATAHARVACAR